MVSKSHFCHCMQRLFVSFWLFCRFKRTGKRGEIFLATKFGLVFEEDTGKLLGSVNGSPEYCKTAIERSLSRLGGE